MTLCKIPVFSIPLLSMDKTSNRKSAGAQTVTRAFELVDLFDDQHRIWSLGDLIKASGLKRTTVFRLMTSLEEVGIVRKRSQGGYILGERLIALGGRAMRANPLRTVARPFMEQLSALTTESTILDTLLILDGRPKSMVVEEVQGHHLLGLAQHIGSHFPAHSTSTGKVLLAYQSAKNLAALDLTNLTQFTQFTITDTDRLLAELADVRQAGYATAIGELTIGMMAIAAPIFDMHGEVVAALTISASESRVSAEKLHTFADPLKKAAQNISRQIGYEPSVVTGDGGTRGGF